MNQQTTQSLVIGVQFDHDKISAALVDDRARVIAEQQKETGQRATRAVVAAITELALSLSSDRGRGNRKIAAIGISVPGTIDPPTGRVSIAGVKGWTRVALRQMLEESLTESGHDLRQPAQEKRARAEHEGSPHPEITINSRPASLAAGESWTGAARGKNNLVFLDIGQEIEAGILVEGRVLQGAGGLAGAADWLGLSENFKPEYKSRGCLAAEASIVSLNRRAIEEWSGSSGTMLGKLIKSDLAQLDAVTIIRAARGGDKLACHVVNQTCRWIGRGAANLISILNPEAIVLGGELGMALNPFIDEIREEAQLWVAPDLFRQCRIVRASLGDRAALLGAARLAWKNRQD